MKSIRAYQRRIQRLTELIKGVQWVQPAYNGSPSCSGCGAQQWVGCDAECPVATVTGDKGGRE